MSHQGFESRIKTKIRWRQKQKAKGLCVRCFKKVSRDSVYCKKHKEDNRIKSLAWYHKNKNRINLDKR